jgi:hypothetical protein
MMIENKVYDCFERLADSSPARRAAALVVADDVNGLPLTGSGDLAFALNVASANLWRKEDIFPGGSPGLDGAILCSSSEGGGLDTG